MKLSFIPGDLHLVSSGHEFILRIGDEKVLSTSSRKVALAKFHDLRREMELRFPARELSPEEKAALLRQEISNSLLGHNSLGGRARKSTAGSTRTFGG